MTHCTALRHVFVLVLAAVAAAVFVTTANAGEFFETDGVALRGHDAVSYALDGRAGQGSTQWPTAQNQTKVIQRARTIGARP
jgi:hypothetical protein